MKKVYWNYWFGDDHEAKLPDEFMITPKKFRAGYDPEYDHAKCPAWKEYTENMWVVKQPFDIGMKVDTKEKRINTDLTQKAYDDYFHVDENWLKGEYPEIQLKLNYVFWTNEKDVWVEQIPHPLLSRLGFELVPGAFPISYWHRPVVVGLKILDTDVNLRLKRGTPLYYFKLRGGNFMLEKKDIPEEWHKLHKQTNVLKHFAPFKAWDVIRSRVREGKCPIKWK